MPNLSKKSSRDTHNNILSSLSKKHKKDKINMFVCLMDYFRSPSSIYLRDLWRLIFTTLAVLSKCRIEGLSSSIWKSLALLRNILQLIEFCMIFVYLSTTWLNGKTRNWTVTWKSLTTPEKCSSPKIDLFFSNKSDNIETTLSFMALKYNTMLIEGCQN